MNSRRKFLLSSLALTSFPIFENEVFGRVFKKNEIKLALQIYSFAPLILQNKLDILNFPSMIHSLCNKGPSSSSSSLI